MTIRTHLVLFPGALGDYLCARPTFLRLRAGGGCAPTIVARPALFPLLAADGFAALSIDRREVADLFAPTPPQAATAEIFGGYERVDSWTGHGDERFARRLAALGNASVRVHPFRQMRPREHASAYYARCAGVRPLRRPLSLDHATRAWARRFVGDAAAVLALHDGSGSARKNWCGMAEVARRWRARGGVVIDIAGPAESERGELGEARPLHGEPLDRVAAVIAAATLYVGNDSGVSHLAAAVGAAGLVLFGPTRASQWAPRGGRLRVVRGRRACRRCGDVFCIHRLSCGDVWAQLLVALED